MKNAPFLRVALTVSLILGSVACNEEEVTGSRGSLVHVEIDAPSSARSGENFEVRVHANNIGISNVDRAHMDITLPPPLMVLSVSAETGTTASVSNTASGARISWELNTLDSNTESSLTIRALGVLPPGAGSRRLTIEGSLTGRRIDPGDAVARDEMDLTP